MECTVPWENLKRGVSMPVPVEESSRHWVGLGERGAGLAAAEETEVAKSGSLTRSWVSPPITKLAKSIVEIEQPGPEKDGTEFLKQFRRAKIWGKLLNWSQCIVVVFVRKSKKRKNTHVAGKDSVFKSRKSRSRHVVH